MLKGAVFLDLENLTRNGGWGMRYPVIRSLVEAQNVTLLRANAYLAIDRDREGTEREFRQRNEDFRRAIRHTGFHLVLKEIRRYRNEYGETVVKANADLDLAVDALLQAENLDYVLLGSGDGDFLRLVRALQNRGKRVDLLSFANTSFDLQQEVDVYFSGFLVPGLLPTRGSGDNRLRGAMMSVQKEKGYGFLRVRTGLGANEVIEDVFCHINDFNPEIDNFAFADFKARQTVLEFELVRQEDGRHRAVNVAPFDWEAN
jgi:uncharacterized LabA/DUF88 family protein